MADKASFTDTEFIELREAFESIAGATVPDDALDRARKRALALRDSPARGDRSESIALVGFATDLFAAMVLDQRAQIAQVKQLIEQIERTAGIHRLALARQVLGAPEFLRLPALAAIELLLGTLLAFTDLRSVSLWSAGEGDAVWHIADAGEFDRPGGRARTLARRLTHGASSISNALPELGGVELQRDGPGAALVGQGAGARSALVTALLEAAGPMLVTLLERHVSAPEGVDRTDGADATAERRLKRLRFDLHDGPQQDVIVLAEDLRVFRAQLGPITTGHPSNDRLLGNLDELQARLVALAGDLRRISVAVESPASPVESLPDAIAQLADDFAGRTGIEPEMRMDGELAALNDSQYITLLALVREALNNIREHGDARRVTISLSVGATGAEVIVTDDGRGFDPESELVRAARGGHLGLVGMHERVRMLGGFTRIDSRPGGPTTISASMPPAPEPSSGPTRARRVGNSRR